MKVDLERQIQDSIYESLRLVEHNDLSSCPEATLREVAEIATLLAAALEKLAVD